MAFSVTVTSPMKRAERISRNLGIYAGQVTIASYATTLVECTAITKYFVPVSHTNATAALYPHGIMSVAVDGVSNAGFEFRWDATTGAFRCYTPTTLVFSGSATGAAVSWGSALGRVGMQAASAPGTYQAVAAEAVADDAVGMVNFIAIGFIK